MFEQLPDALREAAEAVIRAEQRISCADAGTYNRFVADGPGSTAVSASGRTMIGAEAVRAATEMVAKGNLYERNRFLTPISADSTDGMFYVVFKTGVTIVGEREQDFCWVVTLIFRKKEDKWLLVHRQNTRSNP